VAGSVTAMHEFVVTSFSLIDGMGTGKFVSSATFTVAGRDWNIEIYPDGYRTEDKGYVSVFLHFIKGEIGARVKFTISLCLVDKGDQVSETEPHTFHSVGVGWGWFKFIKKPELQELLQPYKDDSCTIKCVLTVMDEPQTEDVSTGTVLVPESNLHQDLSRMLKNGEGADVTFSVGGQLFPAHKWMLAARSMVFKAEFFGAMKERDDQCIKIEDIEPAIFGALLHFVYTDSLPGDCGGDADSSHVAMQHLLVAADRYGLDRLRVMCEEKLCWDIDVETVATTLVLAEQHHCAQLKDACLGFIASRNMLGAVMKTDGFQHLITSCPLVMKEILDKVAAAGNE
jgi:speckle-type POZ protein